MSNNKHSAKNDDFEITKSEFEKIESAFKNDEFKKLFFEYLDDIQDPENRKQFEQEITQLEAERGVSVTFVNPIPGFCLKTSVDGDTKAFVNIAKSDKIERPSNEVKLNEKNGKKGIVWSIPYAQAPPRHDYCKKVECLVYDVIFHPDALYLAEKNSAVRDHVIQVACDAVEREFNVKLDRSNLKVSKLKFKGNFHPIVIRKVSENGQTSSNDAEPNPIAGFYPPMPQKHKKTVVTSSEAVPSNEFQTPKYTIKHRRGVDYSEMTFEIDAKVNITLPKELVVEIDLPLLKSTSDCTLDVTEKKLFLTSVKPAKYRLNIDLPYSVNDKNGSAKFDMEKRKLRVVLPVCQLEKSKNLKDLYREDSGVESDMREDSHSESSFDKGQLIQVLPPSEELDDGDDKNDSTEAATTYDDNEPSYSKPFLQETIHYNFPHNFDCNILDNELAFVLHIKNVEPSSIETLQTETSVHMKFTSIGSGYYPTNYAFYFELDPKSSAKIDEFTAEAWDNNVVLNVNVLKIQDLKRYSAGLDAAHKQTYELEKTFKIPENNDCTSKKPIDVAVDRVEDEKSVSISVKPTLDANNSRKENKKQKKQKNKKRRSLSESAIENNNLSKEKEEVPSKNQEINLTGTKTRKQRSYSECHEGAPVFKGILKHRSSYDRTNSVSGSCSSFDESHYSRSIDVLRITDIPEEQNNSENEHELSESCKKTVRFSDVIQKQLFRLHSSILGQRKKNQKRKVQKQRALNRRNSEGDSADYEENKLPENQQFTTKDRKLSQNDSGLDMRRDSESSDIESKNSLMFDMEI